MSAAHCLSPAGHRRPSASSGSTSSTIPRATSPESARRTRVSVGRDVCRRRGSYPREAGPAA
eukprot:954308-Rhodomonas_salina.1